MSSLNNGLDRNRELLSQAILEVIDSWPDPDRSVFVQSHYQGRPVEKISAGLGMSTAEVRRILESCDRRLRSALRDFREAAQNTLANCNPQNAGLLFNRCCG